MIDPELDIAMLSAFRNYEIYKKYISFVDMQSLHDDAKVIIKAFTDYYKEQKSDINLIDFVPKFFNNNLTFTSDQIVQYRHIFNRLLSVKTGTIDSVILNLRYRKLGLTICKELGIVNLLEEANSRLKPFDTEKLEHILKEFNKLVIKDKFQFFHNDASIAFKGSDAVYFHSAVQAFDRVIGGYNDKYFILVVAGRDGGKTAFCLSEVAAYLKTQTKPVLYLHNEHSETVVYQRFCANILNKKNILFDKFKYFCEQNSSLVNKSFQEYTKGNLLFKDIRGLSLTNIFAMIAHINPGLVVLDQLDLLLTKNDSTGHRPYQWLYGEIRAVANTTCPIIGTTQEQSGGQFFDKAKQKNVYKEHVSSQEAAWSNYDKQGNCDLGLGIGTLNKDPTIKHITVDRHKEGRLGDCYCRLLNDSSRYIDL